MSQDRVGCSSVAPPALGRRRSVRTAPDKEHRRLATVHQVPAVESIPAPAGPLDSAGPGNDPDPNWIRGDLIRAAQALLAAAQTVGSPVTASAVEQRAPARHVRSALVVVQSVIEHLE